MDDLCELADAVADEQNVASAAAGANPDADYVRATFDPRLPASLTPHILAYCTVRELQVFGMTGR